VLEREAWMAGPRDDWRGVSDIAGALAALPSEPARVFLAIGKQQLAIWAQQPQHFYLLRLVDPPLISPPFPHFATVVSRGPFTLKGDMALLREHRITHIVAKNSGGTGAQAKLAAARELGLPVIMIERPEMPERRLLRSPDEALAWLGHAAVSLTTERGV
jgi:precorrin-6A/cobalt-precorrin-6A reductase